MLAARQTRRCATPARDPDRRERCGPHAECAPNSAFLRVAASLHGPNADTVHTIETEARRIVSSALDGAVESVRNQRTDFDRLVAALLAQETLEREDLDALFDEART